VQGGEAIIGASAGLIGYEEGVTTLSDPDPRPAAPGAAGASRKD